MSQNQQRRSVRERRPTARAVEANLAQYFEDGRQKEKDFPSVCDGPVKEFSSLPVSPSSNLSRRGKPPKSPKKSSNDSEDAIVPKTTSSSTTLFNSKNEKDGTDTPKHLSPEINDFLVDETTISKSMPPVLSSPTSRKRGRPPKKSKKLNTEINLLKNCNESQNDDNAMCSSSLKLNLSTAVAGHSCDAPTEVNKKSSDKMLTIKPLHPEQNKLALAQLLRSPSQRKLVSIVHTDDQTSGMKHINSGPKTTKKLQLLPELPKDKELVHHVLININNSTVESKETVFGSTIIPSDDPLQITEVRTTALKSAKNSNRKHTRKQGVVELETDLGKEVQIIEENGPPDSCESPKNETVNVKTEMRQCDLVPAQRDKKNNLHTIKQEDVEEEILAAARALKANYNHLSIIPSNISSVQWFNDIEKCHCKDSNDHSHFHCPMCTKWSRPFSTQQKMSKHLQFHQDRCIEFEGLNLLRCKCDMSDPVHWHCSKCIYIGKSKKCIVNHLMRECGTLPRKRHYDSGSDEEWISKKPKMKQLEDDPELQAMLLVNKRRFRHLSCVKGIKDISLRPCTTCCTKYHCPLCLGFSYSNPAFIKSHLMTHHFKYSVQFKDVLMVKCSLSCNKSSVGRAHWHCPFCTFIVYQRGKLGDHLQLCVLSKLPIENKSLGTKTSGGSLDEASTSKEPPEFPHWTAEDHFLASLMGSDCPVVTEVTINKDGQVVLSAAVTQQSNVESYGQNGQQTVEEPIVNTTCESADEGETMQKDDSIMLVDQVEDLGKNNDSWSKSIFPQVVACLDLSHVLPAHLHATLYQQLSERSNLTVMIEEADKHAYLSGSLPSLLKAYMLLTELIASRPESEIDIKQSLDFQKDNPLMKLSSPGEATSDRAASWENLLTVMQHVVESSDKATVRDDVSEISASLSDITCSEISSDNVASNIDATEEGLYGDSISHSPIIDRTVKSDIDHKKSMENKVDNTVLRGSVLKPPKDITVETSDKVLANVLADAEVSIPIEDIDEGIRDNHAAGRTCPVCEKPFADRTKLCGHLLQSRCTIKLRKDNTLSEEWSKILSETENFEGQSCPLCEKKFNYMKNARIHFALKTCQSPSCEIRNELKRNPDKSYQCTYCEFRDPVPYKVFSHESKTHNVPKTIPCKQCDKKFSAALLLKMHIVQVHQYGLVKVFCEICGENVKKKYFSQHMRDKHGDGKPSFDESKIYTCDLCDFQTKRHLFLLRHQKRVHSNRDYSCSLCHATFALEVDCKQHIRLIHGEATGLRQTVTCRICGKEMQQKNLENHIRHVHENTKDQRCSICRKSFVNKYTLKCHMQTHKPLHERQYKFQCKLCNARFNNKSMFNDHTNIHTNKRPHVCEDCGKSFRQASVLHKHREIHRNMHHVCDVCGLQFPNAKYLHVHKLRFDHMGTREEHIKCECGFTATTTEQFKSHIQQCHFKSSQEISLKLSETQDEANAAAHLLAGAGEQEEGTMVIVQQQSDTGDTLLLIQPKEGEEEFTEDDIQRALALVQNKQDSKQHEQSFIQVEMKKEPSQIDDEDAELVDNKEVTASESVCVPDVTELVAHAATPQVEISTEVEINCIESKDDLSTTSPNEPLSSATPDTELREEKQSEETDTNYQCGYCQNVYPTMEQVQEHMLMVHIGKLAEAGDRVEFEIQGSDDEQHATG